MSSQGNCRLAGNGLPGLERRRVGLICRRHLQIERSAREKKKGMLLIKVVWWRVRSLEYVKTNCLISSDPDSGVKFRWKFWAPACHWLVRGIGIAGQPPAFLLRAFLSFNLAVLLSQDSDNVG